ncbi:MAG: hypothetical protein QOH21_437, partial [Acidobacteriota bacterium]|nr:hypothetical protein [Acidobacteriota bacterium]
MSRLGVYALVAVLLLACGKSETPRPLRIRSVEPWLSGDWAWRSCDKEVIADRVVTFAQCGAHIAPPPVSLSAEGCDDMTGTPTQNLAARPTCADAAVTALEGQARGGRTADVFSDLAAAYYVRAQYRDQPKDLLESLKRADAALSIEPNHPQARFNRALALEALSLTEDAVAAWGLAARSVSPQWAADANAHRNFLGKALSRRAFVQWPGVRDRLLSADRNTIEQAVAAYPGAVRRYVEDVVLPQWAETDSANSLSLANTVAVALAQGQHDEYLLDVVQTIVRSAENPKTRALLRVAHLKFREAREEDRSRGVDKAASLYEDARSLLARAGSPLRASAAVGLAVSLSYDPNRRREALPAVITLLGQVSAKRYPQLVAWIRATRGFLAVYPGGYLQALADYEAARTIFERTNDSGEAAKAYDGKAGVYHLVGLRDRAWREAFHALHLADTVVEAQQRHRIRGEAAATVVELGFPEIALLYQNVTVDMIRAALDAAIDRYERKGLAKNLSIALRSRAGMEVVLGRYARAEEDLNESNALATDKEKTREDAIRRSLMARIDEVRGQLSLRRNDAAAAIAAFTRALEDGLQDEYRTLRVRLYTQRAQARRGLGQPAEAANDLRRALDVLRSEESHVLSSHKRGKDEEVLNIYLSRFDETYNLLIDELTAQHRDAEAFNYAERARAVEPLSLLMQLKVVPPAFRALTHNGQTLELPAIQAQLPAGTFLLQYRVTPERTYAWLISRDAFKSMALPVKREDIDLWTRTLQAAVPNRPKIFNAGLSAPYETLLRQPLETMQQLPGGSDSDARLVIIPDGPMHGLPFAALHDTNGQYLLEKAVLSVDASATLYIFSLLRDRGLPATNTATALLVGDPDLDDQLGLGRLPAARAEVAVLRGFYPRGETLQDTAATIPRFFAAAKQSTIIHFAGHAVTDTERPSDSKLLFAKTRKSNGQLTATALLQNAKLDQTRLVVLAACSSAGGAPVGADGLAPLVRPFVAAGVPAVVGSLWNVGDTPAAELLTNFHLHFRKGLDAATALRRAQRTALHEGNPLMREPFTWAAFQ